MGDSMLKEVEVHQLNFKKILLQKTSFIFEAMKSLNLKDANCTIVESWEELKPDTLLKSRRKLCAMTESDQIEEDALRRTQSQQLFFVDQTMEDSMLKEAEVHQFNFKKILLQKTFFIFEVMKSLNLEDANCTIIESWEELEPDTLLKSRRPQVTKLKTSKPTTLKIYKLYNLFTVFENSGMVVIDVALQCIEDAISTLIEILWIKKWRNTASKL
ncbi:hypothetical protein QE152_g3887 [Popillia japonica]|uniref:Uncharacterized protein n=1 Tax=Popillia japonica TaxID=7064 RepID=A0AAW1N1Z4_POPJA